MWCCGKLELIIPTLPQLDSNELVFMAAALMTGNHYHALNYIEPLLIIYGFQNNRIKVITKV